VKKKERTQPSVAISTWSVAYKRYFLRFLFFDQSDSKESSFGCTGNKRLDEGIAYLLKEAAVIRFAFGADTWDMAVGTIMA